ELLRGENAALQAKVEELEQMLTVASQEAEERWSQRQAEYESLLEEKSEVIRTLHQKMADLRERASSGGSAAVAAPTANRADAPDRQELIRLKEELEEERQRIGEDEESMMSQLRQMEMTLA